jgi:hypothetical protein
MILFYDITRKKSRRKLIHSDKDVIWSRNLTVGASGTVVAESHPERSSSTFSMTCCAYLLMGYS